MNVPPSSTWRSAPVGGTSEQVFIAVPPPAANVLRGHRPDGVPRVQRGGVIPDVPEVVFMLLRSRSYTVLIYVP